jgi:3-oxoacyl-[acyl-carrier protein] reductase
MELARANITANAVIPVAATAMTETVPFFKQFVDAAARGEQMPPFARRVLGFGTPDDVAGVIAYLASDAAAGVTGQAVGVGGDRLALWSHPQEVATAFQDGGWSYDDLTEDFDSLFGQVLQSVGQPMPQPPADKGDKAGKGAPDGAPAATTQKAEQR